MSSQKTKAAGPAPSRNRGQRYALMSGNFIDSYHASNREALAAACKKYLATQFSILKVSAPRKAKSAT
jgi:hypothetical protein